MKKFLSTSKCGPALSEHSESKGFVDPVSLITLGILLVGLVVSTAIVKNPDISLDIRQWAKVCMDDCTTDSDCGENEQCYQPSGGCPVCRPKPKPPTITPPAPPPPEEINRDENLPASDNPPAPETPTTAQSPTQPVAITTKPDLEPEEFRFVQQEAEKKPSPLPTIAPTINCSSFGSCYPNNYTCEKSYGQLNCGSGNKCGVHCSAPTPTPISKPTPTPTSVPTPATPTQPTEESRFVARQKAEEKQKCLAEGNTLTECQAGKPLTTPLKTTTKKAVGETCNSGDECQSGQCFASGEYYQGTVNPGGFSAGLSPLQSQARCHNASTQDYQAIQTAENQGNLAATALAAAALGGAALLPTGGLPVAYLMAQNALAATPAWLQTAGAAAILAQGPLAVAACEKYGADSPQCQNYAAGITAGFFTDPIGTLQALQTSAQQVQNVVNQGFNQFINSSIGNSLFGNPQIGPLDSMYSFNEYTLTSRPQLPSELSPLETHIKTAADLINQGKYTEAIQLLENQQLAAELGVTIDSSGHWAAIPTKFSSTAMTNDDFINLANEVAGSGKHSPGTVTLPSPGYYPITEDYVWGNPLPEPLVREQATVALEEWVHELQMRNNTLLGIPYTGGFSTTQHEDEIALYLYDTLKMQLSEPFLTRPGYNREILGLPGYKGYNLTNFPTP